VSCQFSKPFTAFKVNKRTNNKKSTTFTWSNCHAPFPNVLEGPTPTAHRKCQKCVVLSPEGSSFQFVKVHCCRGLYLNCWLRRWPASDLQPPPFRNPFEQQHNQRYKRSRPRNSPSTSCLMSISYGLLSSSNVSVLGPESLCLRLQIRALFFSVSVFHKWILIQSSKKGELTGINCQVAGPKRQWP